MTVGAVATPTFAHATDATVIISDRVPFSNSGN